MHRKIISHSYNLKKESMQNNEIELLFSLQSHWKKQTLYIVCKLSVNIGLHTL